MNARVGVLRQWNAVSIRAARLEEVLVGVRPSGGRQKVNRVDELEVEVNPELLGPEVDALIIDQPVARQPRQPARATVQKLGQQISVDEQPEDRRERGDVHHVLGVDEALESWELLGGHGEEVGADAKD